MGKPFEIRKEIGLDAGPEQVWAAIATGPGLTAWFMPMEVDPDSPMVTSWEPGRRFAVRIPPAPDGSFQVFDYRIEAAGPGRTVLRFVHSGFTGDDWGDDYDEITSLLQNRPAGAPLRPLVRSFFSPCEPVARSSSELRMLPTGI